MQLPTAKAGGNIRSRVHACTRARPGVRRGRTGERQSGRAVHVPERRGGTPAMTRNDRLPARLARSKRESNSCRCRALELTATRRSSICCRLGRRRILDSAAVTVDHGVLSAAVEICSVP